eukprot:CAMPEP_0178982594 /NCGR_PEP_ID=MMETSP0795-20121207/585_1 /TAXON_ID=88552 /ORGANISM="Amoebophrya sp., Strain Ameob2" /LENGTH=717 /DNA_ID=CAMNT_0020673261 /DNA_START=135 /DNA_END=2288 /DNA_ORIENTATION=-
MPTWTIQLRWLHCFIAGVSARVNLDDKLCGVCHYVRWTGSCEHFGVCGVIDPETCVKEVCRGQQEQDQDEVEVHAMSREEQWNTGSRDDEQEERAPAAAAAQPRRLFATTNSGTSSVVTYTSWVLDFLQNAASFVGQRLLAYAMFWSHDTNHAVEIIAAHSQAHRQPHDDKNQDHLREDEISHQTTQQGRDQLQHVPFVDFRVTKALAARRGGYNKVRVSVVAPAKTTKTIQSADPELHEEEFSAGFEWAWTQNFLHTSIVDLDKLKKTGRNSVQLKLQLAEQSEAATGGARSTSVRALYNNLPAPAASAAPAEQGTASSSSSISIEIPLPTATLVPEIGAGVAGVFLADPCFVTDSITTLIDCVYESKFHLSKRTPEILNAFVGGDAEISFWGILGDNIYDRSGHATGWFWAQLSEEVRGKLFYTVHGNHDYWVLGNPAVSTTFDQCGNGFAQYYGQDVLASVAGGTNDSSKNPPYNLSIDPAAGHPLFLGCNPTHRDNTFYFNQLGNAVFVGFSSLHSWSELKPEFENACRFVNAEKTVAALLLLGHWNVCNSGCAPSMSVPQVAQRIVKEIPACAEFGAGRVKHVMGHVHCNIPNSDHTGGYMVAGWGMHGCGNYGVPVFDTTGGRWRVFYFPLVDLTAAPTEGKGAVEATGIAEKPKPFDQYEEVRKCMLEKKSFRKCAHFAEMWADEELPPRNGHDLVTPPDQHVAKEDIYT